MEPQVAAPVDRRAERLLTRLGGPRTGREQREAVVETACDLDR
jgi:hypothetical protein